MEDNRKYLKKSDKETISKFDNIMNNNINYYKVDEEEQDKILDKIINKFYSKLTEKEKRDIKQKSIENLNKKLTLYFTEKGI